ncbi:MAG: ABC transporter substrate-binding protein [Fimbriimonadaceae bacterium]|nr:ABC transporter substrate-binding protein [Fimbriimonadaceae bacterium]
MRFIVPALAVLTAVALGGCKHDAPFGGTPRTAAEIKKRVVSLSPNTTELVFITNYGAPVVGRTDADTFPNQAAKVPVVVHQTKIDYEMLAGIKPDLILYDTSLYSDAEVAKIKELGAEMLPFSVHNLDEYEAYLRQLGVMVGGETNASEYMDKVYAAVANAKGPVAGKDIKVMVLMGGGGGDLTATGTESILADFVRNSGGNLIGPKGDRFMPVNIEEVIAADPDIIFCPDDSYATISKDPRLANLRAVKNREVLPVKADILLRAGSRVDKLIAAMGAEIQKAGESK